MSDKLNLAIDDDKTISVIAGLIFPGPLYCSKKEDDILHAQRKEWQHRTLLATTVPKGLAELKYHNWHTIALDYDIKDYKGTEIVEYLLENKNKIPEEFYIISMNPYGRDLMCSALGIYYTGYQTIFNVIHLYNRIKV